jgi:oxalate---CoA ligase
MIQQGDFPTIPERSELQTIGDVIEHHAAKQPQRTAIVGSDFAALSFHELSMQIRKIGEQLRPAGIGSSARVGIVLPKGPEVALLGVSIACHAISVPLNPTLNPRELEEEIARFGLDALVLSSGRESATLDIAKKSSLAIFQASKAGSALSNVSLQQIREASSPASKSGIATFRSTALLLKTSGTTGAGKLIPTTHRNLLALTSKLQHLLSLSAEDRCACVLPAHSASGFRTSLLVPLLLGGSVALPAPQHLDDLAEWLPSLSPTWVSASPSYLLAALDRIRSRGGKKPEHCLRFIRCGSSYLPESVRVELEIILGIPILESYGLSEAGGMAGNPAPPAKRKPGTAGVVTPDELAIRNQAGDFLTAGEVGEIVVRGPSVAPGYVNGANDAAAAFRHEWLETGDLGFIDSEGFLTIVGRTKEIINRGGEKISPYEIEKALLVHPSVAEAAAFSVPHPRLGENAAAAVVLKPETNATSSDLKTFLYGRLAHFKVPQHIFITTNFPRGSTGKVSRPQLAAAFANQERPVVPPGSMVEFQIAEIWRRLIGRSDIGVEDDFFEAGGDSLLAARMLLEVETITGQRIPQSSLGAASTIRQLANVVMQIIPATDDLVTCAQRGTGTPFFFCHGDFLTRGFYGVRLAKLLGNDQQTFLLHPYRDSDIGPETSMEAMARSYVPRLLAAQPSGAFRLGGFCEGGLLTWEIAHQLAGAGREVEFVVIVETPSLNARPAFRAIEQKLRSRALMALKKIGRKVKLDMGAVWDRARRISRTDQLPKREEFDALHIEWHPAAGQSASKFRPVVSNYIPPKIDCEIYCVLCEATRSKKEYSPSDWNHLVREVHCVHIAGEQHNCVTTHLSELAGVLRRLLLTRKWVDSIALEAGT